MVPPVDSTTTIGSSAEDACANAAIGLPQASVTVMQAAAVERMRREHISTNW